MNYRDFLQKIIYVIINPIIKGMIKFGITPNIITSIGFILNIIAAYIVIYSSMNSKEPNTTIIGWSGAIILFAGLFDMMDGRLARIGKMESSFGALLDSTLDRYSELFTLFGYTIFFLIYDYNWYGIITFIAMIGSIMVSYVRARAEGLCIECKVGVMQRPERVVLISLGAILCGITENLLILAIPVILIAGLANITAFWRIVHCYKQMNKQ